MVGAFLEDLKSQGLPPNPLINCPRLSVDKVVIGVLRCLGLGIAQEACGNVMWEALDGWDGAPS